MKKLLFTFPIIALLAAGCNSSVPNQSSDAITGSKPKAASSIIGKLVIPITQEEAINLVTNLPEVQAYLIRLKQNKSQGIVAADEQLQDADTVNPYWNIHVYEDLSDHTATFNWYFVYQKTGQIKAQF
jgi:hypothetical protein